MSSRAIAEQTGKPHSDVLKAIRKMEIARVKVNGGNLPSLIITTQKEKNDQNTSFLRKNVFTSLPNSMMKHGKKLLALILT